MFRFFCQVSKQMRILAKNRPKIGFQFFSESAKITRFLAKKMGKNLQNCPKFWESIKPYKIHHMSNFQGQLVDFWQKK